MPSLATIMLTAISRFATIAFMSAPSDEFYRISKLPPYVFAVVNEMKARLRADQQDVVDLGMGNPDGATPRPVVNKMIEAVRNPRNHRYSMSKGIPRLREEIVHRYKTKYDVDLDPATEAIATIGAKGRAGAPAVRGDRARRRGGIAESRLSDPSVRRRHGGRACLHAAHAESRDISRTDLKDLYKRSTPEAEADPDLVPAQSDHAMRGSGFHEGDRGTGAAARLDGPARFRLRRYLALMATSRPAFCRWRARRMSRSRSSPCRRATTWPAGGSASASGNKKMIAALARIKSYLDYGVFQPIQIASIIALRECEEDTTKICNLYQKRRDVLVSGLEESRLAGGEAERLHVRVGSDSGAISEPGIAGILEAAAGEGTGGGVAGYRLRTAGRRFRRFALIENDQRTRQALRSIKQFLKQ